MSHCVLMRSYPLVRLFVYEVVCVRLCSCEVFIVRSCHLMRSCELVFMCSCDVDAMPFNKGNVLYDINLEVTNWLRFCAA